MEKQIKVEKYLSASRIKLLETCSWLYWARYHLNMPDKSNDGARRGTICHLVFELLLTKRHKKHFTSMMKREGLDGSPAIDRLIKKHLDKQQMHTQENYEMIRNMIWVGISNDFYGNGGKIGGAEAEFEIANENPKYKIKGFIDKHILYSGGKEVKIVDYKSSKARFKGEELFSNVQAMMYTLAGRTLWPKARKATVDFLFLRFPKQPVQSLEFSDEQIKGFEAYLGHLYKIINNFTEKSAVANFAYDSDKSKWLCQAGATWVCPLKRSFKYFALKDAAGTVIKCSMEDDLKAKSGEKVEALTYEGCPRFSNTAVAKTNQDDPFDF